MIKILVVEDDLNTRKYLEAVLLDEHFEPVLAANGKEALTLLETEHIDLIITDVMMPIMDGYTLTNHLRQANFDLPILMVTAKDTQQSIRQGFLVGTDDYLVKPIDDEEMILRIKALLRRAKISSEKKLEIGRITLNYNSLTITRDFERITIPKKEFYLLYKLLSYPDIIFTKMQLKDEIWGLDSRTDEHTVSVHVGRLRDRFRSWKEFKIITVRGLGYKAEILDEKNKAKKHHLNLLVIMIAVVFLILLFSFSFAGGIVIFLDSIGYLQPLSETRLPVILLYLVIISIIIAIILTIIVGTIALQPIKKFVQATRDIAGGDFSVRFGVNGPIEYSLVAESLNKMTKKLGGIETLRNDFVRDISHEFKTPIVSIRGFAKLLKKDHFSKEQQQEYLDIIISESNRLSQLSSNVLLLSNLNNSDKLSDIKEFSLDEQLRRTILLLQYAIRSKQITLDIQLTSCKIFSNEEILQQVWINLLNNAIKFTPENGTIAVTLESKENHVEVSIRDNGIGMSAGVREHIFDKFYQGEASHNVEGNGLGLSLVKRIIDLCKGTIQVQSHIDEGTEVVVSLCKEVNS